MSSNPNKVTYIDSSDIISYLVNVFGSRDSFVTEYRHLLANRLLARNKRFFEVTNETRNLELLKLRFGPGYLKRCEVMVKDLSNSKRFNQGLHADVPDLKETTVTLISDNYWPSINTEKIKWPKQIATRMQRVKDEYELRKKRYLKWYPVLGSVELEVTLNHKDVTVNCSPVGASILLHLLELRADRRPVLLSHLETLLGSQNVKHHITFWMKRGIVRKVSEYGQIAYCLPQTQEEEAFAYERLNSLNVAEESERDDAFESNLQQEVDDKKFEETILGLLNNKAQSLESILNTLKLWQNGFQLSEARLKKCLESLVQQKKIDFVMGKFGNFRKRHG